MTIQYVPVFSDEMDIEKITDELNEHGVVVLLTTRTDAKRIARLVRNKLGLSDEFNEEFFLNHLSFEVDDRGWEDCLMYSAVASYDPEQLKEITVSSIRGWISAGEPRIYTHKLRTS